MDPASVVDLALVVGRILFRHYPLLVPKILSLVQDNLLTSLASGRVQEPLLDATQQKSRINLRNPLPKPYSHN